MMEYETIVFCAFVIMVLTGTLIHLGNVIGGLKSEISQLRLDTSSNMRNLESDIVKVVYDKDLLEQAQAKREAYKLYIETIKNLEELSK